MSDAHDVRCELLRKVEDGVMSPDDAEAEAAQRNLASLARTPPPERFDPMREAEWTLPMAVAWITWRRADKVRQHWDKYRHECWDWRDRPPRLGFTGGLAGRLRLENQSPATLGDIRLTVWCDGCDDTQPTPLKPVDQAITELREMLQTDVTRANARLGSGGARCDILPSDWHDGTLTEDAGRDALRLANWSLYHAIRLPAARVRELWQARIDFSQVELSTMASESEAHMPLFCAVDQIIKRSEAEEPASNPAAWRAAAEQLIERIASGAVDVIGTAGADRQKIDAVQFAGIRVVLPFDPSAPDIAEINDDMALIIWPYFDEPTWRAGANDKLMARSGPRWTKLMISREQVAEFWPLPLAPVYRTGVPGRPNSRRWVEAEFEARCERNEVLGTLRAESDDLAEWLKGKHPQVATMRPKSVENVIRKKYREHKTIKPPIK